MPTDPIPTTILTDGSTRVVANNSDVVALEGTGFTAVPRTFDFMSGAWAAANVAYNAALDAGRSSIDAAREAQQAFATFEGVDVSNEVTYVPLVAAPSAADATGVAGQIAYDATHIYVCVAANTWVRASLATW